MINLICNDLEIGLSKEEGFWVGIGIGMGDIPDGALGTEVAKRCIPQAHQQIYIAGVNPVLIICAFRKHGMFTYLHLI